MHSLSDDRAPVDDPVTGDRRKDTAHRLLAVRRERILRAAQRALLQRVLTHGTATADHVRSVISLPEGVDPVCLGAAPGPLARLGIIRRSGYVETTRPCAHSRPVSVWELADRRAAVAWLESHPAMTPHPVRQRSLFGELEGSL
ncbi:MAG TPA: hypothetical protein VL132_21970 [Planctomycetaceae bacterium]|nr:hypothetical protein [Planctomycetaceae bacterium]